MYDGENIRLRPFEEADSEQYRNWVNQADYATLLARALPVTKSEHENWYHSVVQRDNAVLFSVETKSEQLYVGNVWLWNVHWINRNAELRILLGHPEAQGKGYGTEACRLLLEVAFQRLGLHKVYLYVSDVNPRAKRTFEKAGFVEEGRLRGEFYLEGAFRDAFRMAAFAEA